jgi:pimeloyl-ACP methyl ester carboxylesterase
MGKIKAFFGTVFVAGILFLSGSATGSAQTGQAELILLDADGSPTARITDGDLVRLRIRLPDESGAPIQFTFNLAGSDSFSAGCTIAAGQDACETAEFRALGWFWDDSGGSLPTRSVTAHAGAAAPAAESTVDVAPRPVVLVHGFSSSWEAWTNYLGEGGYLAGTGLAGYAVGDGRHPGVMNTGLIADPGRRTNTIAENAAILGEYVEAVRAETGAQVVDLVAHSMGGLISRYYIDRVMPGRAAAQLIMLGSPMAGTDCANLPAELRLYLPASLEIQPSYVTGVFNPQITHRRGVPFHALAGVPIVSPVQSPCTGTPTDLVVSQASVSAIPLDFRELPFLHTDLNASPEVFAGFVLPLLQTPAGEFAEPPDPTVSTGVPEPLQFTRIYTGHVAAGSSERLTIVVEPGLSVANFALYDPTRSLAVTVTGASGNVVALDPVANGLTVLDDPSMMFFLGYGFENPSPGPWGIELSATGETPPGGADYAVRARYQGGALLQAAASTLLPRAGEPVELSAQLDLAGAALPLETARAEVRPLEGAAVSIDLAVVDGVARGTWTPEAPGLYSIAITAAGRLPDGSAYERVAYLAVEVQVESTPARAYATIAAIVLVLCLAGGLIALLGLGLVRRMRRRAG